MILIEHYARDTSVISFQEITNTCTILWKNNKVMSRDKLRELVNKYCSETKELWFSPHSSVIAHSQENGILQGLFSFTEPHVLSFYDTHAGPQW